MCSQVDPNGGHQANGSGGLFCIKRELFFSEKVFVVLFFNVQKE